MIKVGDQAKGAPYAPPRLTWSQTNMIVWPSRFLRPGPVTSLQRAADIVLAVMHNSNVKFEIELMIGNFGGLQASALWDLYATAYDPLVAFDAQAAQMAHTTHQAMPERGLIVDYGAGSGHLALALLRGSPERNVVLLDFSQKMLSLAKSKLHGVVAEPRATYERDDLRRSVSPDRRGRVDGAVVNNVFYTLDAMDQRKLLQRIFDELKPGAPLVIHDPQPLTQAERPVLIQALTNMATQAIKSGLVMSEFQLALVIAINHQILTAEVSPQFSSSADLFRVAESLGFTALTASPATGILVLQKPASFERRMTVSPHTQVSIYRHGSEIPLVQEAQALVERIYTERFNSDFSEILLRERQTLEPSSLLLHFVVTSDAGEVVGAQTLSGGIDSKLPVEMAFDHLNLDETFKLEAKHIVSTGVCNYRQVLMATAIQLEHMFAPAQLSQLKIYWHATNERTFRYLHDDIGLTFVHGPGELQRAEEWLLAMRGDDLVRRFSPRPPIRAGHLRLVQS